MSMDGTFSTKTAMSEELTREKLKWIIDSMKEEKDWMAISPHGEFVKGKLDSVIGYLMREKSLTFIKE